MQASSQNTPPSPRLYSIQALRGLAVLMVVAFHLFKVDQKYAGELALLPDWFAAGTGGVDLFFVISGFIMMTVTRACAEEQQAAGRFLYHRATRIYPLYWLYSLVVLGVFLVKPAWVNAAQGGQVDLLASFLLLPQNLLPLLSVGWTLIFEIYFYLVFALVLLVPRVYRLPALFVFAASVCLTHPSINAQSGALLRLIGHPLNLEFVAGCLAAAMVERNAYRPWFGTLPLVGVACAATGYFLHFQAGWGAEPDDSFRVLIFGLPACVLVFGCAMLEKAGRLRLPRPLVDIGNMSYSIYLGHLLVLSALGRFLLPAATTTPPGHALLLLSMVACVLAVGRASFILAERPLLSLTRRWEPR